MTNEENELTYKSVSSSILENMCTPIIHGIIIESILNEQVLRSAYGTVANPKYVDAPMPITDTPQLKRAKLENGSSATTPTPPAVRDLGRLEFVSNGKDVFANYSKAVVNSGSATGATATTDDYFKCLNCDRKIAGSRFASHIDRCLGGRQRK